MTGALFRILFCFVLWLNIRNSFASDDIKIRSIYVQAHTESLATLMLHHLLCASSCLTRPDVLATLSSLWTVAAAEVNQD